MSRTRRRLKAEDKKKKKEVFKIARQ